MAGLRDRRMFLSGRVQARGDEKGESLRDRQLDTDTVFADVSITSVLLVSALLIVRLQVQPKESPLRGNVKKSHTLNVREAYMLPTPIDIAEIDKLLEGIAYAYEHYNPVRSLLD